MTSTQYSILVVEDDEVDVANIQRAFQKANLVNPMHFAGDGQEAIDMLNSGQIKNPLLILLDIKMPRKDGIEFLTELRTMESWNHVPVVMLTTSNAEKDKLAAYNLNVSGYILKPVSFADFVEVVTKVGSYWSLSQFPETKR